MNKTLLPVAVLLIIAAGGVLVWALPEKSLAPIVTTNGAASTTPDTNSPSGDVTNSKDLDIVLGTTTITVTGQAKGYYFEASFPVYVNDASGARIAQGPAQAQSDWMVADFVPFKVTLTFPKQPSGSHGTLILHNDNPSGMPENDKFVSIPIVFK